jgi:hypothetical protein
MALAMIIQIIMLYTIIGHLMACLWIVIAHTEPDPNDSWLIKVIFFLVSSYKNFKLEQIFMDF